MVYFVHAWNVNKFPNDIDKYAKFSNKALKIKQVFKFAFIGTRRIHFKMLLDEFSFNPDTLASSRFFFNTITGRNFLFFCKEKKNRAVLFYPSKWVYT